MRGKVVDHLAALKKASLASYSQEVLILVGAGKIGNIVVWLQIAWLDDYRPEDCA